MVTYTAGFFLPWWPSTLGPLVNVIVNYLHNAISFHSLLQTTIHRLALFYKEPTMKRIDKYRRQWESDGDNEKIIGKNFVFVHCK